MWTGQPWCETSSLNDECGWHKITSMRATPERLLAGFVFHQPKIHPRSGASSCAPSPSSIHPPPPHATHPLFWNALLLPLPCLSHPLPPNPNPDVYSPKGGDGWLDQMSPAMLAIILFVPFGGFVARLWRNRKSPLSMLAVSGLLLPPNHLFVSNTMVGGQIIHTGGGAEVQGKKCAGEKGARTFCAPPPPPRF